MRRDRNSEAAGEACWCGGKVDDGDDEVGDSEDGEGKVRDGDDGGW